MSRHLTRKSDAQANAEALSRRSTTYADEHAASWQVRFGGLSHEMTTQQLLRALLTAYADEVPMRMHEGPHNIDAGGVPAMTGRMLGYVNSGDSAVTTPGDLEPVYDGQYRKPLQAAIAGMKRSPGKVAWWGAIVERIVISSESPMAAALAEGSHRFEAVRTANEALAECHRRLTPTRVALPRKERVA